MESLRSAYRPEMTQQAMMKKHVLILTMGATRKFPYNDYLIKQGLELIACHSVVEAMYKIKNSQLDLIIIDTHEPLSGGVDLLLHIGKSTTKPIMMFANHIDTIDHVNVLEAGADDYVQKNAPAREVLARINVCLRRTQTPLQYTLKKKLNVNGISLCMNRREVKGNGESIAITGLEFELLYLLMSNAGEVVPREAIGECVFKRNISYCDRSLNMHVSNLRKKLKEVTGVSAIKTIRGTGYIFL